MPLITSDKDLPRLLDTPSKQVKWTKKLVAQHLGTKVKHVDRPPMQGMFSRTFFVTLADAREIVVQFRNEVLDVGAFEVARKALGPVVPIVTPLQDDELADSTVWAYSLTRIPGQMWLRGIAGKGPEGRIAINKSLGRVFSKGCLSRSSDGAVDGTVRPHLEAILASPLPDIEPYRPQLESLLAKLDQLKRLPLWVAHYDLNEVNVLIDEDCRVTGLIDWEMSSPLPFGVGFGRVHTIAGEYTGGEFWMPDEFEEAERAFWGEMFGGMDADVREALEGGKALVQDAVILGTLLDCFCLDEGKACFNPVCLKALPKFLTYRIPLIRGNEAPYKEDEVS